ncbi:hypothetical protein FBU30_004230 [Linnemannia zychae]|nr:hypothetical protein FBU30_004230 [Linnemannia zychae]
MSSQRKPRTQRYSAQIRASQYDPDVDVNHYSHFATQQQQSHHSYPQRAVSPRASIDVSADPAPTHLQDHYADSSTSSNSAATTVINLSHPNSSNNSNNALVEPSVVINNNQDASITTVTTGQTPLVSNSIDYTSSGDKTAATEPNAATSLISPTATLQPPSSSVTPSASSFTKSLYSIFPTSNLTKKPSNGSNPRRHIKTASQPRAITSNTPLHLLPRSFGEGRQFQHAKTPSVASVRSRLVARTSRSSLQLNLRTNQNNPNPTLIPTPSQSPGGTWDDPHLAPSPYYPNMDPAFLKEQQLAGSGVSAIGDSSGYSGYGHHGFQNGGLGGYNKENPIQDSALFTMNRQDDGRIQLEQAREYYKSRKCLTWTRSKLLLMFSNTILLGYAVILMMAIAPFGIFVALLGYIGIFTQSRKVLTFYTILLWPLFAMITSVGYITFRRSHVSLYQKLKFSWINEYSRDDRLVIQNALNCCGYRSTNDYPSYDLHCFPRAPLPSCESKFLQYQQELLTNTSSAAFSLLPIQLMIMIVALLCSNHIDNLYRSAYPKTPKLYTQ